MVFHIQSIIQLNMVCKSSNANTPPTSVVWRGKQVSPYLWFAVETSVTPLGPGNLVCLPLEHSGSVCVRTCRRHVGLLTGVAHSDIRYICVGECTDTQADPCTHPHTPTHTPTPTMAIHCLTLPCRCHKLPPPYAQGRSPSVSPLMQISSSCHEGHCLLLLSLHQQTWTTSSTSVGTLCQEDLCQPFSLV